MPQTKDPKQEDIDIKALIDASLTLTKEEKDFFKKNINNLNEDKKQNIVKLFKKEKKDYEKIMEKDKKAKAEAGEKFEIEVMDIKANYQKDVRVLQEKSVEGKEQEEADELLHSLDNIEDKK